MEVLANATVIIILQYINGSNQYAYTCNFLDVICQLYLYLKKSLYCNICLMSVILGRAKENRALFWVEGYWEGRT